MMARNPNRIIMRVEILARAADAVDAHCSATGMTHVATQSRIMQFLLDQDELTQAKILGLLPVESKFNATEAFLKKLVKEKSPKA